MKTLYYILPALIIGVLTSCSKDKAVTPTPEPVVVAKRITDSISLKLDGITYSGKRANTETWGNDGAYRKLDSVVKNVNYVSGVKDSVFYYRSFMFYAGNQIVLMSFCKIFNKNDMVKTTSTMFYPHDEADALFKPAKYNFVTSFKRENSSNGVAIKIAEVGQSYAFDEVYYPDTFKPYNPGQANFEITSLKKTANNQTVIEAKFDVPVYTSTLKATKVTDGYMRLVL